MAKKEKEQVTYSYQVRINGILHDMDDMTEEERKEIGRKLNKQAMESMGYTAVGNKHVTA